MENKIGGYFIGIIVATFVGCIFLVSTMTGFLPYHEQTKQAQIWANAQVEMTEIVAEKEVAIKELETQTVLQTSPIYLLGWVYNLGFGIILFLLLGFILVIVFR